MFRFKECREMRGLTQKYVAISLGVKAPSVSDWENGKTNPTLENLVSLADLLGVSTDMLLGVERNSGQTSENENMDRTEQKLLDDYRSLNKQGREYILQTMTMAVTIYKNGDFSSLENRA